MRIDASRMHITPETSRSNLEGVRWKFTPRSAKPWRNSLVRSQIQRRYSLRDRDINSCVVVRRRLPVVLSPEGVGRLEPDTDSKLCAVMNDLPPISPFDRGG